jgi:hypothetical protein
MRYTGLGGRRSAQGSRGRSGFQWRMVWRGSEDRPVPLVDTDPRVGLDTEPFGQADMVGVAVGDQDGANIAEPYTNLVTSVSGRVLGIPFDEVMQAALIPVAHTVGTDFQPAIRTAGHVGSLGPAVGPKIRLHEDGLVRL